jgi:DNA polymerase elongation subunit (family B)
MKEKLLVLDADYILEGNKGVVRLFCKDEKGKTVLVLDSTFEPYFYALHSKGKIETLKKKIEKLDTKKLETNILKVETVERRWMNGITKLVKITIDNPRKIPDVRNEIKEWKEVEETYEYDIPFYKRYIMDKNIEPMNWIEVEGETKEKENYQVDRIIRASSVKKIQYDKEINFKILAFDTEWVKEEEKTNLIMLSYVCSDGHKKVLTTYHWKKKPDYVEVLPDEKGIIEKFLEIIKEKDPDFLVGYNSDGFDIPKIKDKANESKLSLKLGRDNVPVHVVRRGRISSAKTKGRIHIDLFNFIDHVLSASMKSEVLTLDEVSRELLGTGKKKMQYEEMVDIWSKKENMERLTEYSLWDSELTIKLSHLILPQVFTLCKLTGLLPFDCSRYTYSQLVEGFFMKKAVEDNVLIPNRPKTEEIEQRRMAPVYKGAIVIEPKKGIHSNVLVFDFRSLYPTIIVSHNIDPGTFNSEPCKKKIEVPENKWYFCQDKKGFIPEHLEEIINARKKVKEEMKKLNKDSENWTRLDNEQYALKILANATYGYLGYFGAKWFKRECGASAAAFGRYYITKVVEMAKEEGFEILYGDTDSLMTRFPKELHVNKIKELGEKFTDEVNEKLPGIIELEFRDLYEGGIFVARHTGEAGAKKRYALIDYDGNLEIRGFETVRRDWCELSKKIQKDVLTTILKERDPVKAVQLVRDTIKKIKDGDVKLEDLVIFEQVTRPLSQYEQIGPHVKAAQKAKSRGKAIGEGSVIGFVIIKGSGSISDRAEPVEDVKPNQYDPDYYIEHQILPASMRVLKALGYTEQQVLSGKIQASLGEWFKK